MEGTRQSPAMPVIPPLRDGEPVQAVENPPERKPLRRIALIAIGAIALVLALVYGLRFLAYASAHESTDDAMIDADQVQVTSKITERVERVFVDTNKPVRKGQLLIALDDVDARSRLIQAQAAVAAQRAQARAAEAGVVLTRDTQVAQNIQSSGGIAQAQAGISSAADQARSSSQQIAVASAGVDAARAQLKAAHDALPGALENLRRASADLKRTQSLVASGDVAAQQLDASRAAYQAARSQYSQAQANVAAVAANGDEAQQRLDAQRFTSSSSAAQIGVQRGQLTTAQGHYEESAAPSRVPAQQAQADAAVAQVGSLQAQLQTARNNLTYTRILSPINGYVGQKIVEIGQTVAPGESLLTLIPVAHVYVTANFKETQIGHMRVGQEVDINVDAYKGVKFVGHVQDLSPASQNKFSLVPAQNATGNFVKVTQRVPIRILFDRVENGNLSNYPLRPGMSVETSVKVK